MKLWLDDINPAPEGYVWCKSVRQIKYEMCLALSTFAEQCRKDEPRDDNLHINVINLDTDLGEYCSEEGNVIDFIHWLEWLYQGKGTYTKFHIHSNDPKADEFKKIILENGWTLIE